jgi:type II secretion system protein N
MIQLGARDKRIVKWVGYPLLALLVFLFVLGWTFPYERLQARVIDALDDKYDVTIADVHGTFFPGGVVFKMVMLKTRPTSPDEKPVVMLLDEVELDLSLLELLLGRADVDLIARVGGGTIEGNLELSANMIEAELRTEGLPLASVPGLAGAVGLPMSGSLDLDLDVRLVGKKWKNAEGKIDLRCKGCTIGDGEARLKMAPPAGRRPNRASAFAAEGVTVPRLDLGDARAVVAIDKGLGTIKEFAARSKDGWLKIDGKIEFKDPFGQSTMPGCMTFQLSDELRSREPTFSNIEFMLPPKAKQTDGSFAIPTKGKLSELRWDVHKQCGSSPVASDEDDGLVGEARPGIGGGFRDEGGADRGGRRVMPAVETADAAPIEPPAPGGSGPTMTGDDPAEKPPEPQPLPAEPVPEIEPPEPEPEPAFEPAEQPFVE